MLVAVTGTDIESRSLRSAWIEIPVAMSTAVTVAVALLAERVD